MTLCILAFAAAAVVVPFSSTGEARINGKPPAPFVAVAESVAVAVPAGATLVVLVDGRQVTLVGPVEGPLSSLLAAPAAKEPPAASSSATSRAAQALSSWLFASDAKDNAVGAVRAAPRVARFLSPSSSLVRKGALPFEVRLPAARPPVSHASGAGEALVVGNTFQVTALPTRLRAHDQDVAVWTALDAAAETELEARLVDAARACGPDPAWCTLLRAQLLADAGCFAEAEGLLGATKTKTPRALVDPPLPWRAFDLVVDATWSPRAGAPFVALEPGQRGSHLQITLEASRAVHVELLARLPDGSFEVAGVLPANEVHAGERVDGLLGLPPGALASSTLVVATLGAGKHKDGERFSDPELEKDVRAMKTKGGVVGGGFGRVVVVVGLR
ncbi:MAG: hypothetical protein Q8O67_21555 [Deltaproteobacteria bacterium]|nr:hypothetical protein [Deltaproteobacteria bacterium]